MLLNLISKYIVNNIFKKGRMTLGDHKKKKNNHEQLKRKTQELEETDKLPQGFFKSGVTRNK